jgi:hypothetical protein
MARGTTDLPASDTPGGMAEQFDPGGAVIQRRYYEADGRAVKTIDFGHDHTGVGDPHAHDCDWTKNPPRQPPRAILPGE